AEVAGAPRFDDRGGGVLERNGRGGEEARRTGRAELGDPVVVDAAVPDGELGIVDRGQREREAAVEDGCVDALRVEDLDARARIEPGAVTVGVVTAPPQVRERR